VSEVRIDVGPDARLIILLAGGSKRTQAADIRARQMARGLVGVAEMKRKAATTRYDVAEHLRTPEEMAAYLEACLEEADGEAALVAKALGDIARAEGMSPVARDAGLSRESLYKALSGERSPDFDTILKVMGALGLRLHAEAPMVDPSASASSSMDSSSRTSGRLAGGIAR
jgi:probable addiction module antidote protein